MNLAIITGLLLAVLTVQFVQGDETPTTKKNVLVYDSETDSWGDSDLISPTNSRVPCTNHGTSLSTANEGLKPAVQEARPPRCDPPKQILVYDSDTDSWEEAMLKNC